MKLKLKTGRSPDTTFLMAGNQIVEGVAKVSKIWAPGRETRYIIEIYEDDLEEVRIDDLAP